MGRLVLLADIIFFIADYVERFASEDALRRFFNESSCKPDYHMDKADDDSDISSMSDFSEDEAQGMEL